MSKQPEIIDLVWGVSGIAKLIGRSDRQTYEMCVEGQIPVRQVGRRWVAERSKLIAFFMESAA